MIYFLFGLFSLYSVYAIVSGQWDLSAYILPVGKAIGMLFAVP